MAKHGGFAEETAQFFIEAIEKGAAPWMKPWKADEYITCFNPVTKTTYQGANQIILTLKQLQLGSGDPRWMTFLNARAQKYKIKKGSLGTAVQFYDKMPVDKDGKKVDKISSVEIKKYIPIARTFIVFNGSQIEGIPPYEPLKKEEDKIKDRASIENAEKLLVKSGAKILHDSVNSNYYLPKADEIHLTAKHTFKTLEDYYSTALHELSHWTGHKTRLDRSGMNQFASKEYAKEELRAEIGSYMLCKDLNLDFDPQDHTSYAAGWAKTLKNDHGEVISACRDAEKIRMFCMKFVNEKTEKAGNRQTEDKTLSGKSR